MPNKKEKKKKLPSVVSNYKSSSDKVIRNIFAVGDEIDPHESLRYMQEMFRGKVDEDVVTMIFSECAYNVDQALETLITLSNDREGSDGNASSTQISPQSSSSSDAEPNKNFKESTDSQNLSSSYSKTVFTSHNEAYSYYEVDGTTYFNSQKFVPACLQSSGDKFSDFTSHEAEIGTLSQMNEVPNVTTSANTKPPDTSFPKLSLDSIKGKNGVKSISGKVQEEKGTFQLSLPFYDAMRKEAKPEILQLKNKVLPQAQSSLQFITPFAPLSARSGTQYANFASDSSTKNAPRQSDINASQKPKTCDRESTLDEIRSKAGSGKPVLIIMRGLPGSGKSTLARELGLSGSVFSTDDYFVCLGKYKFDGQKVSEAHHWNQERTLRALQDGVTPVVIDNTNVEVWEMMPYVKLGLKFKYDMYLVEPNTPYKFKPWKLSRKNTHRVSKEKIQRMLDKFNHNVTIESIVKLLRDAPARESSESFEINSFISGKHNEENKLSKIDSFSDDSVTGDSAIGSEPKVIALEAVVHREDEFKPSVTEQAIKENDCTNVENQEVKGKKSDDHKLTFEDKSKIDSLNELRSLCQDESEGSQNLSQPIQSSDSSQEISGWDAITERDDDFFWSSPASSFHLLEDNVLKCDESVCTGDNSSSWCPEKLQFSEKLAETFDKCDSELKYQTAEKGSDVKEELQDFEDSLNKCNGDIVLPSSGGSCTPKPQGELLSTVSKYTSSRRKSHSDCSSVYKLSSELNWPLLDCESAKSWNDEPVEPVKEEQHGDCFAPKPQRKQSVGNSVSRSDTADKDIFSAKKNCGTSKNKREKAKKTRPAASLSPLFNFMPGGGTCDWEFPEPLSSDSSDTFLSTSDDMEEVCVPCSEARTQTEPSDFILLRRIENNPLFISDMKTLTATGKVRNEVVMTDDVGEPDVRIPRIASFDKSTYTDDMMVDIDINEKIKCLQLNFNDILEDDLRHLLEIFEGDSVWLSSTLTELDYEYSVPVSRGSEPTCQMLKDWCNHRSQVVKKLSEMSQMELSKQDALANDTAQSPEILLSNSDMEKDILDNPIAQPWTLTLDPTFASALEQQFGPVNGNIPALLPEMLTVSVDLNLAKHIYDKWTESIQLYLLPGVETSEVCTPEVEIGSISLNCSSQLISEKEEIKKSRPANEPLPLSEIMDMEYALQLHKEEKLKQSAASRNCLANRLKRIELHKMFPGVDTLALDDVFDSNNCSLELTMMALEADIGKPAKLPFDIKESENFSWNVSPMVTKHDKKEEYNPHKDFVMENWTDWVCEDGFLNKENDELSESTNISPEVQNIRTEAAMHYQLRQECNQKAQNAYTKGMKEVASFYAQKGEFHGRKFKEANKKASELILSNRNKCLDSLVLDLHGLYVQEAVPVLTRFLNQKKAELNAKSSRETQTVTVVTGRGAHSIRVPRLRPSIMNFLKSSGHRFDEINLGVFNIQLSTSLG